MVFHHGCLECTVCKRNMEGKQITLDTNNRVYCTEDYDRWVVGKLPYDMRIR